MKTKLIPITEAIRISLPMGSSYWQRRTTYVEVPDPDDQDQDQDRESLFPESQPTSPMSGCIAGFGRGRSHHGPTQSDLSPMAGGARSLAAAKVEPQK